MSPQNRFLYSISLMIAQFNLDIILATATIPYFYILIDSNPETTCCFQTMPIKFI